MLEEYNGLLTEVASKWHATELENRRWLSFEESSEYVAASAFRFFDKNTTTEFKTIYEEIKKGESIQIQNFK